MTQQGFATAAARAKCFPGWNAAAKPCDYCHSTAALLFCRSHAAFMCISCDTKVHTPRDKHARVWMCEVCELAPAAVTCKADAATLCVMCDSDIHSANPLARRHERSPVVPFFDTAEAEMLKSTSAGLLESVNDPAASASASASAAAIFSNNEMKIENDCFIPDSWMFPDPIVTPKIPSDGPDLKPVDLFFSDSDQFLEFENYPISSCQTYSNDSIVPIQTTIKAPTNIPLNHDYSSESRFEIDFTRSNISYTAPSLSHSLSSSSMDVGVVPDGSTLSDISYPFVQNLGPNLDPIRNQGSKEIGGIDREARVLRYKEKRKNRKFEKTVRYASRKAYAETRPRIKGRFAKRTDVESDIDRMYGSGSSDFISESRYGIVPSF